MLQLIGFSSRFLHCFDFAWSDSIAGRTRDWAPKVDEKPPKKKERRGDEMKSGKKRRNQSVGVAVIAIHLGDGGLNVDVVQVMPVSFVANSR